jgi:hypothetical protein
MKVDGIINGIYFTFFVGVLGIICLFVFAMVGGLAQESFTSFDYILIIFGGLMESIGMIT